MSVKNRLRRAGELVVEELQMTTASPESRSVDRFPSISTKRGSVSRKGDVDKHFPDRKSLQDYWELYQRIPIIRHPIRSFASEVVAPGYYVETDNEELKEELEEWLSECAIVDGEIDRDFRILLKKSIIQREVKGTSLSEKVSDDNGNLYGFKPMRPETVRAFTLPGQTILIPPDFELTDDDVEGNSFLERFKSKQKEIYRKPNGDAAAYVQMDDAITGTSKNYYIPFSRDDVIKLTRDSDVGEVFGNSRLLAIEDRLHALLKKLEDNDKAIESLAHPFQLFKFGSEDDPWEPEEIEAFMSQHSQDDFEPGMKQGVQGDLNIDLVSGEVADIESFLDFDLNWVLSELPMPRYALGGFESEVNQFVSRSQEKRLEKQIEEARHEIEIEWTPVLREKAEELGYSSEEVDTLVIGEDPANLDLLSKKEKLEDLIGDEDIEVIDTSEGDNVPDGNNTDGERNQGESGTDFTRPPASSEEDREENDDRES